jgi:hypothetical protein
MATPDLEAKILVLSKQAAGITGFEAGEIARNIEAKVKTEEAEQVKPEVKPEPPAVAVDLTAKPNNAIEDGVLAAFAGNNSPFSAPLPPPASPLPVPSLEYESDVPAEPTLWSDTEAGYESEESDATRLMSEVSYQEHVICDPSGEPVQKFVPVGPKIPTKKWKPPPGDDDPPPGRGPPTALEAIFEGVDEDAGWPSENRPKSLFMPMAAAFGFLFLAYVVSDLIKN